MPHIVSLLFLFKFSLTSLDHQERRQMKQLETQSTCQQSTRPQVLLIRSTRPQVLLVRSTRPHTWGKLLTCPSQFSMHRRITCNTSRYCYKLSSLKDYYIKGHSIDIYFQDSDEQEQLLNEFTSKFHMERSKAEEVCNINAIATEDKYFVADSQLSEERASV